MQTEGEKTRNRTEEGGINSIPADPNSSPVDFPVGGTLNIKEMEEKLIAAALEETGGNRTKAAEKLGITSRTLRNKLKELGLKSQ
jgi:DNA-binding NtrC family response regulator